MIKIVMLLTISCLILSKPLDAQKKAFVINDDTKEPLINATIELKYQHTVKFHISDSTGAFLFDTARLIRIKIAKAGYLDLEIFHTELLKSNSDPFRLVPSGSVLEAVEVRYSKPLVHSDASKIQYDVARDTTLKDRFASEAVARLPFVSMDALNNISYKNKRPFIVLVNGKKFGLFTDNPNMALQSIPASMIKSVELIFDPPLEFKLRGYDAVINIITMPGYFKGALGSVGGSANSIGNNSLFGYLSYQRNLTYIQVNYEGRKDDISRSFSTDLVSPQNQTRILQNTAYTSRSEYHNLGISIDQKITTLARFGLYASFLVDEFENNGNASLSITSNSSQSLSAYGTALTGKRHYFELGADFNQQYGKKASNYSVLMKQSGELPFSNSLSGLTPFNRENNFVGNHEFSAQFSNLLNLKENVKLETVLKYIRRNSNSTYTQDTLINEKWSVNQSGLEEKFFYNIASVNNAISYNRKKISARIGVNIDYAEYQARILTEAGFHSLNFLPMGSFRVLIGKDKFLDANYSSTLYRPSIRNLIAVTPSFDPQLIIKGNPSLRTYIHHRISTEYSFYFGKKGSSVYTGIDFSFSNSFYNSFSIFDSTTNKRVISYRQSRYEGIFYTAGGEFTFSDRWSMDGSLRLGYTIFGSYTNKVPIYELYHSMQYKISKNSGVQLLLTYDSRIASSMGYQKKYGTYLLNIYKFVLKRKLQINLNAENVFHKNQVQKEVAIDNSFISTSRNISPFRSFKLRISYRFGKLQTFQMKSKQLSNSDTKKID